MVSSAWMYSTIGLAILVGAMLFYYQQQRKKYVFMDRPLVGENVQVQVGPGQYICVPQSIKVGSLGK